MADKNNQTTHPGAPPEPGSIVNSQSSIVNLEIPCSPDPLQHDPPIPACLLSPVFCLLSSVFYLLPFVPLWLSVNYAKQTQFPQAQNQRNPVYTLSFRPKPLTGEAEESTSILSPSPKSPIWPKLPTNHRLYYAKQTQFQNGQNEHKCSNANGLCQLTTNNEQRTLFKTNPNKANFNRRNSLLCLPDERLPRHPTGPGVWGPRNDDTYRINFDRVVRHPDRSAYSLFISSTAPKNMVAGPFRGAE